MKTQTLSTGPELLSMDILERAAATLRVLAHPVRLKLVELLTSEPYTVNDLAEQLGEPQHLVSQHLNHMKAFGILSSTRKGRSVHYRVIDPRAREVLRCIRRHCATPPQE